jgi:hypothetical protein
MTGAMVVIVRFGAYCGVPRFAAGGRHTPADSHLAPPMSIEMSRQVAISSNLNWTQCRRSVRLRNLVCHGKGTNGCTGYS